MTAAPRVSRWLPGLDALQPVDLRALGGSADLQRRFDHKYIVEVGLLPQLVAGLGRDLRVLEIEGRRSTAYTNVYFDTGELQTYRDHVQRRRLRYKIRTRHYGDPARAMLEVKCKGSRGQTVKHRWPHPAGAPDQLGQEAAQLISRALDEQYGLAMPGGLAPTATTRYERVTLVNLEAAERITIDLGLSVVVDGRSFHLGAGHAVVETKAARWRGSTTAALTALRLRPEPMSKYCVGIAASHEAIRGNLWLPALRRMRPGCDRGAIGGEGKTVFAGRER